MDSTAAQMITSKDLVGITNFYADDAIFMPPNMPQAATPAEISSAWAGFLQANPSLSIEATKIEIAQKGDLAYSAGTYRVSMDGPTGVRIDDEGKYVVVWKKITGQWKIAADIFNSNRPLAPADTTRPATP
jgi:ketosteroid isomerase-like protein